MRAKTNVVQDKDDVGQCLSPTFHRRLRISKCINEQHKESHTAKAVHPNICTTFTEKANCLHDKKGA